jgi:hypothetical protein
MRARDQLGHINYSYKFLPITCTSTKDVDLVWEDFSNFYTLIYFTITLLGHAIADFQIYYIFWILGMCT